MPGLWKLIGRELATEEETVGAIEEPDASRNFLPTFWIIAIPVAQRLTPGTRAGQSERSEREGSPATAEGRRIVVPLVKLRLSPEQRVHHLATLITLLMVYLNLGFTSSFGGSPTSRYNLSGNCGPDLRLDCSVCKRLKAKPLRLSVTRKMRRPA